jgi:hypothetical protein
VGATGGGGGWGQTEGAQDGAGGGGADEARQRGPDWGGRTGPDGARRRGPHRGRTGRVYILSNINNIWNLTNTIELKHLKTVAHADNKF